MQFKDMGLAENVRKLDRQDLIIFLIPLIIFSAYLWVFYPGIATIDTFNQLHQIASGKFTTWHPFFHTFIEMLCLKIYPGTASICILQILIFSTMWMVICRHYRDGNARTFRLQAAFTLLICLIPINALYSVTLWKDVLFSYFLMFLCFLAMVMIERNGDVDWRFILLLSIVMAFVSQLRGNGRFVIAAVLVVYFAYLFIKKNRKMAALLVILSVTFILLISSLNIAYDVSDNEKDAFMTKMSHMLADYDLNLDMEASDRNTIHEIIDADKEADYYTPTGNDPILAITDFSRFDEMKSSFVEIAVKYSIRNPLHCLEYLFGSSPMVWNIVRDHWIGRPYYLNGEQDRLQSDFNSYYGSHGYEPTTPYENLSYANWGTPAFNTLNLMALGIEGCLLDTIFNNPALYMYISIAILILLQIATKSREVWLMYLPNFLNIVIIFLSTPIQDYRYLYANLLVCYLLVIILIAKRGSIDLSKISLRKLKFLKSNKE